MSENFLKMIPVVSVIIPWILKTAAEASPALHIILWINVLTRETPIGFLNLSVL